MPLRNVLENIAFEIVILLKKKIKLFYKRLLFSIRHFVQQNDSHLPPIQDYSELIYLFIALLLGSSLDY